MSYPSRLRAVLAALVIGGGFALASLVHAQAPPAWLATYREPAARLIGAALVDHAAWRRLAELTDTFGHRLSGSPASEAAVAWALAAMRADGLENVRGSTGRSRAGGFSTAPAGRRTCRSDSRPE